VTRYFAKDPTELGLSVSAMVWRDDEILLMRRSDNGCWGLPGGFVELGESVSEAARREVEEETGWSIEIGRLIGVYSDPAHQVVDYGAARKGPAGKGPARKGQIQKGPTRQAPGPEEPDAGGAVEPDPEPGAARRIQVVNLCFHAKALAPGTPTTPDETLEMGFFPAGALPEPFVPIHQIRIEDGLAGRAEASVR
jgi:ADP-ribose pyrophosphatase YjhB (NUDIX family)